MRFCLRCKLCSQHYDLPMPTMLHELRWRLRQRGTRFLRRDVCHRLRMEDGSQQSFKTCLLSSTLIHIDAIKISSASCPANVHLNKTEIAGCLTSTIFVQFTFKNNYNVAHSIFRKSFNAYFV